MLIAAVVLGTIYLLGVAFYSFAGLTAWRQGSIKTFLDDRTAAFGMAVLAVFWPATLLYVIIRVGVEGGDL